jgi:hypothetical protein
MPSGWDYGGVQRQMLGSTAYQWNFIVNLILVE